MPPSGGHFSHSKGKDRGLTLKIYTCFLMCFVVEHLCQMLALSASGKRSCGHCAPWGRERGTTRAITMQAS